MTAPSRLRVAFMGTPDFAVPTLDAILRAGHAVPLVFTRAPAASGRGLSARPSAVHRAAEQAGLDVACPASLKDGEAAERLRALDLDVAVVVAYGLLLPAPVLDAPRLGCLNLHASLLPRWRGAAPIQRAVMAGDRETGVAVMRMERGLDTGPVAAEIRVPIGPDTNAGELHDLLAARGADLMADALSRLADGTLPFTPQADTGVTYASKIRNDECRVAWSRPATAVHDQVRGLSPVPGAFFEADLGRGPERIRLLRTELADGSGPPGTLLPGGRVACGNGAVRPVTVQRAGKGPVAADAFWRGARLPDGFRLPEGERFPEGGRLR